jgi:hypothetical protein
VVVRVGNCRSPGVTVVAVALGARWALAKDHEVRRRGRSEELAVSAVGTLDLIDRKLQHVRWNALPIPDVSERQQRLSEVWEPSQEAFLLANDMTKASLYLADENLRIALAVLTKRLGALGLALSYAMSRPHLSDVMLDYSNQLISFVDQLRAALGSFVRGESFVAPADPGAANFPNAATASEARPTSESGAS